MKICDKAKELLGSSNNYNLTVFCRLLEMCESPVEQILLVSLFGRWGGHVSAEEKRLSCHFGADYPAYDGVFTACCELQKNITTLTGDKYRVDFFIYLTRFGTVGATPENKFRPELAKIVVEVDGHDFHDRTKEQASRDRERDRKLLLEGCPVIRFTGSDVYNDPERCAEEIDDQLNECASEIFFGYMRQGKLEQLICGT